jgi:hypothetical protein
MSRQVASSNDPPGPDVGCDEVGVCEPVCVADGLDDGDWLCVEFDGDAPLEHPAVITAVATIPVIDRTAFSTRIPFRR